MYSYQKMVFGSAHQPDWSSASTFHKYYYRLRSVGLNIWGKNCYMMIILSGTNLKWNYQMAEAQLKSCKLLVATEPPDGPVPRVIPNPVFASFHT